MEEGQLAQTEIHETPLNIKKNQTKLFYGDSNQGLKDVGDTQNPTGK